MCIEWIDSFLPAVVAVVVDFFFDVNAVGLAFW